MKDHTLLDHQYQNERTKQDPQEHEVVSSFIQFYITDFPLSMAYMEIIIGDGDACKDIYRTRRREKLNAHKKQKNLQSI